MEYEKFGSTIVLRLDKGDEIMSSVKELAAREQILLASVSGIGGSDDITAGTWNGTAYDSFHLTKFHELTSIAGNLTTMNGEPYAHLHVTCAEKGGAVKGGHLLNCVISLTGELFIHVIEGKVDRKHDDVLNLNTFHFPSHEKDVR